MRWRLASAVLPVVLATACFSTDPPWSDAEGEIVSASQVIEHKGFARCGTQSVTFLEFFGRQFAKDPEGVLGTLLSLDGSRELSYEALDSVPPGAVATGITRGDREIYVDEEETEDYLYVVYPTRVERWPRAEVYCED